MKRFYSAAAHLSRESGSVQGCLGNGTLACTIEKPPLSSPEAPSPAIARPIMSMFEDVAAPHNMDPNSKMAKKLRNTH
jgi:hypothetical protein